VLWQSRLRQRNLPDADHYHYDGDSHNLDDGDTHNLDEHFDDDSHDHHDAGSHNHDYDDVYVPTDWQLLHRRQSVL
jgi:hypothetical protein